jgi:uncharacterized membrane protein YcaP (DUF421 family)
MGDWMQIFGGDLPEKSVTAMQVTARTLLLFLFGLIVVRLGKSRLLARATGVDVLVGVVLGSLLARGMLGSAALSTTMAASVALVTTHAALTRAAVHSHTIGNLAKGHERPLIENGRILWDNLRKSHISEHDLREALRLEAHIDDPSKVKVAYKERSGEISVILQKEE